MKTVMCGSRCRNECCVTLYTFALDYNLCPSLCQVGHLSKKLCKNLESFSTANLIFTVTEQNIVLNYIKAEQFGKQIGTTNPHT